MNTKRMPGRFRALLWGLVRGVLPVVASLGLLVLIIAWLAGAFETKIAPRRIALPEVDLSHLRTELVHSVNKVHIDEAMGTLKAESRTVISSKLLASIDEIRVAAGDQVKQGDILVKLQDQELRARLQQAEQAHLAATANRAKAEKDVVRNEALYKQRAVAKSVLEESSRRLQVAQAEELRAEQAGEEARVMLSYTIITAPKAGRVVDRLAQPGDTIRPGDPLLVLYDATSLRLEASVAERLVAKLNVGESLKVYIDAHLREYDAVVDEIVPQADAPSRSFLVKAALPKIDGLYEGMFGRLRIPLGKRPHLCLATAAIQKIGQLEFVDVVTGDSLERRMVQIGRIGMPGRVEVLSGLRAGEKVVVRDAALEQQETE